MLQKAKTHPMPLGNHMTQQKHFQVHSGCHSGLFRCHSASFWCNSGSFWYILAPFLLISFHSGVIPPHSGIFRYILFRSVPVFSNACPSGLFCLILLSFRLVLVYSGTILVYSVIAWHFWEDLGPQLSHDATCFGVPFLGKMFAPLVLRLPSWSAMQDVCVTCAKKCAVTMGTNILKWNFISTERAKSLSVC